MKLLEMSLLAATVYTASVQEYPPSPEELGRGGWTVLHMVTIRYPDHPTDEEKITMQQFFDSFARVYPCQDCSKHFRIELQNSPPVLDSKKDLSEWLCRVHNNVNARLGKSQFNCANVMQRWDPSLSPPKSCPCAKNNKIHPQ